MVWKTSYYHFDAVGSTRELTDSTQSVPASYRQSAFGQQLTGSDPAHNPFRFVGELGYYFDVASGLFNVRQRIYDPSLERWLSQDQAKTDINLHRYVWNCPLNSTDPYGLESKPITSGDAQERVNKIKNTQQTKCGESFVIRFLSQQYIDQSWEEAKWKPDPDWNRKSKYGGQWIHNKNKDNLFRDIELICKNGNCTVIEIVGHAQRDSGITIGDKKPERGPDANAEQLNQTYVGRDNAKEFGEQLKALVDKLPCKPQLIILQACAIGNYSKQDKNGRTVSTVQIVSDATGIPVLSPGGYSKGSLTTPGTSKVSSTYHGMTNYEFWRSDHREAAHYEAWAYESKDDLWYWTTPDRDASVK